MIVKNFETKANAEEMHGCLNVSCFAKQDRRNADVHTTEYTRRASSEISTGAVSRLFRLIGSYSVTEISKLRLVIRDTLWENPPDATPVSWDRYDYPIGFQNHLERAQ